MVEEHKRLNAIFESISLLSGRRAENRLVKVAMYEHLAPFGGGPPNSYHFRLYSEWAKHNWGIIITGNVAITKDHLTLGRDMVLPADMQSEAALLPFRELAKAIHGTYSCPGSTESVNSNRTLAIMQLNHSGRQSANLIGGRPPFQAPLAPSPIRIASSSSSLISHALNNFMFQLPQVMTQSDVQIMIERFVGGGILAHRTGFDGIQLHAAHGYLLAQFLSPKTNRRMDIYSTDNALDIIHTISRRIRESTSSAFIISVKLNAAEYTSATSVNEPLHQAEQRALNHVSTMATWGILDFIEISGGDYEKPDFMMSDSPSKTRRQAFFASFSHKAMKVLNDLQRTISTPPPLILLTGGLKNLDLLSSALEHNQADLLGIGRGSIICPDLPGVARERLQEPQLLDNEPFGREPDLCDPRWTILPNIKIVGAGVNMAWYVVTLREIASVGTGSLVAAHKRGRLASMLWMWMPMAFYKVDIVRYLEIMLIVLLAYIVDIVVVPSFK